MPLAGRVSVLEVTHSLPSSADAAAVDSTGALVVPVPSYMALKMHVHYTAEFHSRRKIDHV